MSNKGLRFYEDENHRKEKLSHLKIPCERIKKIQKNIKF